MSARATEKKARGIAVVAGSGLGGVADGFEADRVVAFADIPGVGECTVQGHRGEVRWCRDGDARVVLVLGRRHFYEGSAAGMRALSAWLAAEGVTGLVVVSAAGGLDPALVPGDLVLATGLVDLQNRRDTGAPVSAAESFPGRPDRRPATSVRLEGLLTEAARSARIPLHRGTVACGAGPTYETRAEVRWLQEIGTDLATMSAAPEVAFALESGLAVACVGVITNPATGIERAIPGHDEVLEQAARASATVARLIRQLIVL